MLKLSRRWKVALIVSATASLLLFLVAEYFRLFDGGLPTTRVEEILALLAFYVVTLFGWRRVFLGFDAAADHELHENYRRAKGLFRAKERHERK